MRQWPSTRSVFLPNGDLIPLGARVVQKDLARTLRLLVEAEGGATTREGGIRAARDRFYTGDIAEQLVRFACEQGGWLTMQDLAEFHVTVEEKPVKTTYRGYEVYACGPWCQGPVVPQTLNILEQYDLAGQANRRTPARCGTAWRTSRPTRSPAPWWPWSTATSPGWCC